MSQTTIVLITFEELCQATPLPTDAVYEVIEHGIVEPVEGGNEAEWRFESHVTTLLQKALRLQRDLDINWQGIAMVLDLLEERDQLLQQNRMLQQRLSRFLEE